MTALSVSATLDKGTSNMPEDMTGDGMEPLDFLLGKAPSGGHVRRVKYEKNTIQRSVSTTRIFGAGTPRN